MAVSPLKINEGLSAYRKTQHNSSNLPINKTEEKLAAKALNILRAGDDIEVQAGASRQKAPSFSSLVDTVLSKQIEKVGKAENAVNQTIISNEDLVEVMAAVNESETALQEVVAIRDKFILMYQEIIKMPL
jgi:flagellar hook-basal body complex protein FliE